MRGRLAKFGCRGRTQARPSTTSSRSPMAGAAFEQKRLDMFKRMHEEGKTIRCVPHDIFPVQRFCYGAPHISEDL